MMSIKDYIAACNASLKSGKRDRAKRAFDLAWKEYANGCYDDRDEQRLFWLRENFYVVGSGYGVSEKASFYEAAILASARL